MDMDAETAQRLIALNRKFYAEFGQSFSETRQRLQPGVREIISKWRGDERILDLGCGNGELARTLAAREHRGSYLGLDFSPPLLREAQRQPGGFTANFHPADLTASDWPLDPHFSQLDIVTAFAVLHHIPGWDLRYRLLQRIHTLLAPDGRFIHSEWQFLNSAKLKRRIQPWERVDLADSQVDDGDYLLDWRSGGEGLRYVHHFSEEELADLAAATGFMILDTFFSDGEGGRLGLYQVWQAI